MTRQHMGPRNVEETITNEASRLVSTAAIYLPEDVKRALRNAQEHETSELAKKVFGSMLRNLEVAEAEGRPSCQDTGTVIFYVKAGDKFPYLGILERALRNATIKATADVPLRPNSVNIFTGKNSGNNTGESIPWIEWELVPGSDTAEVTVVLKGGGSEGPSIGKVIPPAEGMKGVYKLVLDDIFEQGPKPCPPVVVGVGLGPTVDIAMKLAKKSLLIDIGQRNPDAEISKIETSLLEAINKLGWGPHGVGGSTTALDVHIEAVNRHPASFAVGVATACWEDRKSTMRIDPEGKVEFLTHQFLNRRNA
ncbi:MAG TPA: fumarate hydratase [Nitrososphaerales archaeon]|nr:fumarate hydratase [Nitrososphaerales archaeon]